jgi:hypothetical protein
MLIVSRQNTGSEMEQRRALSHGVAEAATMDELESIIRNRSYQHARSYSRSLAAMLQPTSFTDFSAHPEFDKAFELWTQGDRYRGLDMVRLWSFVLNIKHTLPRCPGSLAEVGVYKGHSAAVLSCFAEKAGRKVYLADTFDGFAESQFEADFSDGKKSAFKDTSLAMAQDVVGAYAGNRWIVGLFPASATAEMRADSYSFVSLDCDIYEPIYDALRFFWPRMTPGGMIFVHDYSSGHWPGATRAVDQFCAESGVRGMLLPDLAGSYVLVRQGRPERAKNAPFQAG